MVSVPPLFRCADALDQSPCHIGDDANPVFPSEYMRTASGDEGVEIDDGIRLLCWLVEGAGRLPLDSQVEIVTIRYEDGSLFGAAPAS